MRRLKDNKGNIVALELTGEEMAKALDVAVEDLRAWTALIKPTAMTDDELTYRVRSPKDIQLLKKRAFLLRTRMTVPAVIAVEKAGLLDAYAALAEDCPDGLTAHVWRSYGLVVLMQIRYGKMIDAKELAERASLTEEDPESGELVPSVDLATKHLRMLQALGYLQIGGKDSEGDWTGQWKHQGLPKAWQGMS